MPLPFSSSLLPYPVPEAIPLIELGEITTLDDAVAVLGLLLCGHPKHDGALIVEFCECFKFPQKPLWREIASRCRFPDEWTLH